MSRPKWSMPRGRESEKITRRVSEGCEARVSTCPHHSLTRQVTLKLALLRLVACVGNRILTKRFATGIAIGMLASMGTAALSVVAVQSAFPFPFERLQHWPTSPRVEDATGTTLLQIVGVDDHWRFPVPLEEISPWLINATLAAEDERFESHCGVDTTAIVRAMLQNLQTGSVHSGASTLTMQLCRMVDDRPRTIAAKVIEASRALEVESRCSKSRILNEYLNLAPYGGNLRGVEAAAQRYFHKSASDLSLGEAALLAGLPQSPSRYRPDRYPRIAEQRRIYVLNRMLSLGQITAAQYRLALTEPVVDRWTHRESRSQKSTAPHAAWMALHRRPDGGRTTIDTQLQTETERLVAERLKSFPAGTDAAVAVLDVESSAIVTLVGSADVHDETDGQVNGAIARRSPGSALKPFLYAAAFESGRLTAASEIPDRPIHRGGWSPDNFDREFRGRMTAGEALRQSRNVPAVLVQEAIGTSRCLGVLSACGVSLPPDVYQRSGLTLAVGGVETTLLELTNAWATLARNGDFSKPRLFVDEPVADAPALTPQTARLITDILSTRHRVPHGLESIPPGSLPWFAWKTGTSSGRRDAWAVGHNTRFAIGVWVGRFSGTGHSRFVGREAAEPILAALFSVPSIANHSAPTPAPELHVTRPLEWKADRSVVESPLIVSPADQSRFVSSSTSTEPSPRESVLRVPSAVVPVAATADHSATWFLNGRVIPLPADRCLRLPRGSYELRAVADTGATSRVRFVVE